MWSWTSQAKEWKRKGLDFVFQFSLPPVHNHRQSHWYFLLKICAPVFVFIFIAFFYIFIPNAWLTFNFFCSTSSSSSSTAIFVNCSSSESRWVPFKCILWYFRDIHNISLQWKHILSPSLMRLSVFLSPILALSPAFLIRFFSLPNWFKILTLFVGQNQSNWTHLIAPK